MIKFTFPKELRLLNSLSFVYVFEKSKRISTPRIIIFGRLNELRYSRVGLAVSKKNVKLAHERNRIKRLIRESFRLHQHELIPMDFVVIARNGITNLDNYALLEELRGLWNHYFHLAHEFL